MHINASSCHLFIFWKETWGSKPLPDACRLVLQVFSVKFFLLKSLILSKTGEMNSHGTSTATHGWLDS